MTITEDEGVRQVRIVADGPFGSAVADQLSDLLAIAGCTARVARTPLDGPATGFMSGGDFSIRASWRDVRAELDEFAAAAAASGRPWLPVTSAHPYVRIGPAVVPGLAPCYACYSARVRQHADAAGTLGSLGGLGLGDQLQDAFTQLSELGVTGHPPHVAAVAAGLALIMLRAACGGDAPATAGRVALIDCDTDAIRWWQVIPAHGCPECGPAADHEAVGKARRDVLRALAIPGGCGRLGSGPEVSSADGVPAAS
jgi:bacteriocin biosynthesis cyclodehydratase domain-containing protein